MESFTLIEMDARLAFQMTKMQGTISIKIWWFTGVLRVFILAVGSSLGVISAFVSSRVLVYRKFFK